MESISTTYGSTNIPARSLPPLRQDMSAYGEAVRRLPDNSSASAAQQQGVQLSSLPAEFRPYSPAGAGLEKGYSKTVGKNQAQGQGGDGGAEKSAVGADSATRDPQVQAEIARLKSIELKVKAHEAAHKAVGGAMTGPVSYTYQRGPDGRNYIVGGEVPIEISSGSTPQETISRMQQVISAALAPADPSPQDRAVAAQASNIQQQARQQAASESAPAVQKHSSDAEKPDKSSDGTDSAISRQSKPQKTYTASSGSEVFRPVSVYA